MHFIFIYGPPAAGKYTVAKLLAERTGYALFHNHLIVDSVAAVFAFGSPSFVKLREAFWMQTFQVACKEDRSLIFTFQPESSVSPKFPERVAELVRDAGARISFIHLKASRALQEARIANESRDKFGKLKDVNLLKSLHADFEKCESKMPISDLVVDTADNSPRQTVQLICERFHLS